MTTASDKAGAFLTGATGNGDQRESIRRDATGEHARLRELMVAEELSDDETAELDDLTAKYRAGDLRGSAPRRTFKRQSVGGERRGDNMGDEREPASASESAARFLTGRS